MGGHALSRTTTHRIGADAWRSFALRISDDIAPHVERIGIPEPMPGKTDHGDLDLVVVLRPGGPDGRTILTGLGSPEVVSNGGVTSGALPDADGRPIQVDLIHSAHERFDVQMAYQSWGDLGNMMGRVAVAGCGLHYGWDGVFLRVRDTSWSEDMTVTRDTATCHALLGYDPVRFKRGFASRDEVWEFAISSSRVTKRCFALESLDAENRSRNKNRPGYMAFLDWASERQASWPDDDRPSQDWAIKHIKQISDIDMQPMIDVAVSRHRQRQKAAMRLNGGILKHRYPDMTGPQIGTALAAIDAAIGVHRRDMPDVWSAAVLNATDDDIDAWLSLGAVQAYASPQHT